MRKYIKQLSLEITYVPNLVTTIELLDQVIPLVVKSLQQEDHSISHVLLISFEFKIKIHTTVITFYSAQRFVEELYQE